MNIQNVSTPLSITTKRLQLILQGRKIIISIQKRVKLPTK